MARFRDLKHDLRETLSSSGWREGLAVFDEVPARRLAGPLFSLLLDRDEAVRWRAVAAFGRAVARLADSRAPGEGLEAARVVLRQCLWRMNEESGGLGWGVAEAMGETLALHGRLAGEFHRVLASYVREEVRGEGNYLEHTPLRRGVYWALGRLAQVRPELVAGETPSLVAALADGDGANRGLAAWALGLCCPADREEQARLALAPLDSDPAELTLFLDGELVTCTVGGLARQALARLGSGA
ncbi:HEAT-like repeat-containing protein [Humidesulfovibrio mexicanus]|uniref:HEAT-like repeat-containing protein n=1 Tax=Humidesulfovibrio mexicanus TaxID=147047 RepID=A0A239APS2_9BACT|nr:DVU0298 family protein [Humidesulfovibrio mexicanus]SNR97540.1 HEAT-like repeat-containing protein [Humidesulfovibrio mexicanus]